MKLRNMGSYMHNQRVTKQGSGDISVVYRPSSAVTTKGSDYLPCQHCFGYFRRPQL
jgi:hypothetical protein